MPIEGPLRELGMHDVFQLLHLSRKTGMLRIMSGTREAAGFVVFESGRVIHAGMGSQPLPVEAMLVAAGRITALDLEYARKMQSRAAAGTSVLQVLLQGGAINARDLERQVRRHLESVVFELMAWREGFFSFEERPVDDVSLETRVRLSTESLLMESARRIDEWSRIADKVPALSSVPMLVDANPGTRLDLTPQEWEVLAHVNDARDVHGIAETVGRPAFEIAKVICRLCEIGLVQVRAYAHG